MRPTLESFSSAGDFALRTVEQRPPARAATKLLTPRDVVVRIAIIISVAELMIMLMLRALPHEKATYAEAIVDTLILVVLSTPAIYLWVIRPFVGARDEALAQVARLALIDPLTQLANRRLISRYLTGLAASSVTNRDHGAVLLMDLDGFKPVNDLHGHEAGDAVLVEVADRLRSLIRSGDLVGRLGGDEFVVLVQRLGADVQIAHDAAVRMAEKLLATIKAPIPVNGKTVCVSASMGIRLLGFEELDAATAIREADLALYRAKEAGRDRVVVFGDVPESAGVASERAPLSGRT